jgi:glycerol-3-phosphate dehydrogenase
VKRDFPRLGEGPFDLLVIGGGIYGAWAACDATRRGLRTALVEKNDWASGTSSASSKLLHGGLRYLERLHLGLVRTSLNERARMAALAPHLVRPVKFLLPVYRGDRVGRLGLRAGLTLYDLLGGGRPPFHPHEALSPGRIRERAAFLTPEGLKGGFTYGDCVMDDARIALEVVAAAVGAGCTAVNGAEALSLAVEGGRVRGARIRDGSDGREIDVAAQMTLCCAGAWTGRLLEEARQPAPEVTISRGTHLVMPALPTSDAMLLQTRTDGRIIFLIPWYGRTLLGTTDRVDGGNPDDLVPGSDDADYLLAEAGRFMAGAPWSRRTVAGSFAGLRVLRGRAGDSPSALGREWSMEAHLPGLLVPVGGKYTSARADAAKLVDRALHLMGRPHVPATTAAEPLPWAPAGEFSSWLAASIVEGRAGGLDGMAAETSARRAGRRFPEILELIRGDSSLAARIHPELPFCRAEAILCARGEMVRNLEDLARRRIPVSILAPMTAVVAADLAALAGAELGWDEARRRDEAASVMEGAGPVGLRERRPAPAGAAGHRSEHGR